MDVLSNLDFNKNELQKPKMESLASAPSNPVIGQYYYNTTDDKIYYYNGTKWVSISSDINSMSTQSTSLTCTLPDNL